MILPQSPVTAETVPQMPMIVPFAERVLSFDVAAVFLAEVLDYCVKRVVFEYGHIKRVACTLAGVFPDLELSREHGGYAGLG